MSGSSNNVNGRTWTIAGRRLTMLNGPLVMGILNVTPDSFSDGGKHVTVESAVRAADKLAEEGADILDIGGESTRPGSKEVDASEEIRRVLPVLEAVRKRTDLPLSVDTTKSVVARAAVEAGAEIINDISGLRFDPQMAAVAAETKAGLVVMHLRGSFESMHKTRPGGAIVSDVIEGLRRRVEKAEGSGVSPGSICIDPGIGFSKTFEQTIDLMRHLERVASAFEEYPLLVAISRKSFIGRITGEPDSAKRLAGTIAANCLAVSAGANIVRVHDVKAAVDSIKVMRAIRGVI
ncbi:MAG: dihydropteroate synthase [Acidobacteriota bacterium]|nr:dihydropteroate synthase [Acidobacteriota bacterium]MDH3529588.1 dihydropteroate synthase [Acidobacteriota bacterium]